MNTLTHLGFICDLGSENGNNSKRSQKHQNRLPVRKFNSDKTKLIWKMVNTKITKKSENDFERNVHAESWFN